MKRFLLPLIFFVALIALFGVGLTLKPGVVPSPLIGKPAPDFKLPLLQNPEQHFSPSELLGQVWLLNVWASWCAACREEHPILVDFAKTGMAPVVGLNHKDRREDGMRWLARFGNPYLATVYDFDGRVGIDYGVYGVPETYVIDKTGVIRFKQIGPITPQVMQNTIVPLVKTLNQ